MDKNPTIAIVKKAITTKGGMALCENPYVFAQDRVDNSWCLMEPDVFFPDDDYIPVTKTVAEKVIKRKDVFVHVLNGIKIYRRC